MEAKRDEVKEQIQSYTNDEIKNRLVIEMECYYSSRDRNRTVIDLIWFELCDRGQQQIWYEAREIVSQLRRERDKRNNEATEEIKRRDSNDKKK